MLKRVRKENLKKGLDIFKGTRRDGEALELATERRLYHP